jgi:hypothetical protein
MKALTNRIGVIIGIVVSAVGAIVFLVGFAQIASWPKGGCD